MIRKHVVGCRIIRLEVVVSRHLSIARVSYRPVSRNHCYSCSFGRSRSFVSVDRRGMEIAIDEVDAEF